MLGKKLLNSSRTRAVRQLVNRSVPFLNGDDLRLRDLGKDFAKSPYPALVNGIERRSAIAPQFFQRRSRKSGRSGLIPIWVNNFQQVAAMLAAKAVGQGCASASDAAQLRDTGASFGGLFAHCRNHKNSRAVFTTIGYWRASEEFYLRR